MQNDESTSITNKVSALRICPLKYSNNNTNKSFFSSSNNDPSVTMNQIYCRCGHGFCDVKTSQSNKNPGREYFACPIKRGARCSAINFVKWCDDPIDESYLHPTLIKYPECECGAGVCRKMKETELSSNKLKYYFACPIKPNHGSCGYRVWEDELLNNASMDEVVDNASIDPIRQSKHRSLNEFQEGDQNDTAGNDLANDMGEGSDFILTTKRMRITDSYVNPSPVAVSETPEGKCEGSPIEVANSKHVGFSKVEDDLELSNLASWAAIEAENASFGIFPSFDDPTVVPKQTKQTSIFPSFDDPTVVPKQTKQTSTLNSQSECNDLAIKSTNQCTQLSTNVVSPNKSSPGSESKLKAQIQEMAIFRQQRLVNDLEDLDPSQHEVMKETAEATFCLLNVLGIECKQFSDLVWEFINLVSSMAEIDNSMVNSLALEEHNKFLEEEKMRLANICDDHMKTEALLKVSNKQRNSLCEEISRLESMLFEKRNELKFCELETMKVETQLDDLKRRMLEIDVTIKDKARQAEEARKKFMVRDTQKIAAKTALEKAKHALEN